MKINAKMAASGAGLLAAIGLVIGGVALAASPSPKSPAHAPARAPAVTSSAPSSTSAAVAATTSSAAPRTSHGAVSPSKRAVAPRETTVSEPTEQQTSSSSEQVPVQVVPVTETDGRAGNAPPPDLPPPPPVAIPSGYKQPSSSS